MDVSAGAPPPPARKGRSPLFWFALGCVGCATLPVVMAALFAGTLGGGFFYMLRVPVGVARAQLADIREGKLDAAYARLSDDYKARLSRTEFGELLEKHPVLRDNTGASFHSRSRNNDRVRLAGSVTSRAGAREAIAFELARVGGRWMITAIEFPAS